MVDERLLYHDTYQCIYKFTSKGGLRCKIQSFEHGDGWDTSRGQRAVRGWRIPFLRLELEFQPTCRTRTPQIAERQSHSWGTRPDIERRHLDFLSMVVKNVWSSAVLSIRSTVTTPSQITCGSQNDDKRTRKQSDTKSRYSP